MESTPRTLPLPPGTYTLLPLVAKCDNAEVPVGPWDDQSCRLRLEQHKRTHLAKRPPSPPAFATESALDDDEEDDSAAPDQRVEDEFLVPFFVELPPAAPGSNYPTRPSSRAASFSRLTPIPSLRSSSPTPSYPQPSASSRPSPTTTPIQPIGFLRPSILRALLLDNAKMVGMSCRPVWAFRPPVELPPPPPRPSSRRSSFASRSRRGSQGVTPLTTASGAGTPTEEMKALQLEDVLEGLRSSGRKDLESSGTWAVGFEDWVNEEGEAARKEHMDRLVRGWKMAGLFPDALSGWRNEHYSIYGPAPAFVQPPPAHAEGKEEEEETVNPLPGSNVVFSMERAACALFGFATFGVHCTAYVEEEGQPLKIWVPRRSPTKQTWPSKLDNTVAGGITSGDSPYESIVRECAEEASLSPSFVEAHLRSVSVVSYTYRTPEGWLQPEVQYCYDLKLPVEGSETPHPNAADGEVESFVLMEIEEVVRRLCDGEFKPNCALVLIDFFLRHGFLTPESDARFLEVVTRMRRTLVLPGPV